MENDSCHKKGLGYLMFCIVIKQADIKLIPANVLYGIPNIQKDVITFYKFVLYHSWVYTAVLFHK